MKHKNPSPGSRSLTQQIERAALDLRHELHENPEPSNEESETAGRVEAFLADYGLRPVRRGLGGHGLLYRVQGGGEGPRRLFRADLDALPIHEQTRLAYRSRRDGTHHACGHDGHMAMLAGALAALHEEGGFPGEVWGVFQPAEETGEGAARVLDHLDDDLDFDRSFAIHNHPGTPLGSVLVRRGIAARASVGLAIRVTGRRGHASEPDNAVNPLPIASRIALALQDAATIDDRYAGKTLATLVGIRSDGPNFGVSPADASVYATLRGDRKSDVERLVDRIRRQAERQAADAGAQASFQRHDPFPHTENHPDAVREVKAAARTAGLAVEPQRHPLSASEDFGHFTARWPGALLLLGSGEDCPSLHSAGYDFPDRLLPHGIRLWTTLAQGTPTG